MCPDSCVAGAVPNGQFILVQRHRTDDLEIGDRGMSHFIAGTCHDVLSPIGRLRAGRLDFLDSNTNISSAYSNSAL